MIAHRFGKNGPAVPRIGQGTWQLPARGAAADEAKRALRRGVELGLTHIDTAEMYGDGSAEEAIAQALADVPRESLFIVSKVLPSNAAFGDVIAACEASLRRMKLKYLDCYLLHWRGDVPLAETMRALEKLVDDGKIRALGVSNFDVDDLREARRALVRTPIACNQVLYNPWTRNVENKVLPYCREHGIALVGYTPFGRKDVPSEGSAQGRVLAELARKHGATPRQIMLAFLTRDDDLFAIPKASNIAHVEENAGAADLRLSADDLAAFEAVFPVGTSARLEML